MHERRSSISVKDARDEALRLRQAIPRPDDDDDDDDDEGLVLNAVTVSAPPPLIVVQVITYSLLDLTPVLP